MKKMIAGAIVGILVCGGLVSANGLSLKSLNFLAPTVSDKFMILNPKEGEIVYERNAEDAGFWGYTDSQWIPLGGAGSIVPTGTVFPFLGTTPPAGYKMADGSTLSVGGENAALYALIGGTFGENVSLGTFNLPDLRGRFVRGLDTNNVIDPGPRINPVTGVPYNGIGSLQDDELKSHTHTLRMPNSGYSNAYNSNFVSGASMGGYNSNSVNAAGGAETRPKNMALNYIIKL